MAYMHAARMHMQASTGTCMCTHLGEAPCRGGPQDVAPGYTQDIEHGCGNRLSVADNVVLCAITYPGHAKREAESAKTTASSVRVAKRGIWMNLELLTLCHASSLPSTLL
jgi:hypothetical protein